MTFDGLGDTLKKNTNLRDPTYQNCIRHMTDTFQKSKTYNKLTTNDP